MKYKYAFVIEVDNDGNAEITYECDYTHVKPEVYERWDNKPEASLNGFVVSVVVEMEI